MENCVYKIIEPSGDVYFRNYKGQYHRLDGPAVEWVDGTKYWYINGLCHRIDGPAAKRDGFLYWFLKDKFYKKSNHNRLALFSILEPRRIDINPSDG